MIGGTALKALTAIAYIAALGLGGVSANHAYLATRYSEPPVDHAIRLLASSTHYGLGALTLAVIGTVLLVLHRTLRGPGMPGRRRPRVAA